MGKILQEFLPELFIASQQFEFLFILGGPGVHLFPYIINTLFGQHVFVIGLFPFSGLGFINKFITETADDKRKTKEVNDAKVATYNTLLGKFTELNTMVATIEEMIYGISVDALLQKV